MTVTIEKFTRESFQNPDDEQNEEKDNESTSGITAPTKEDADDLKPRETIPSPPVLKHPAKETEMELEDFKKKKPHYPGGEVPININIYCDGCKQCSPRSQYYLYPGTRKLPVQPASNQYDFNLTGYSISDNLAYSPSELGARLMSPSYLRAGLPYGSTDNAKIDSKLVDVFTAYPDCYTYMKPQYFSVPQKRYSVTNLADMDVYK